MDHFIFLQLLDVKLFRCQFLTGLHIMDRDEGLGLEWGGVAKVRKALGLLAKIQSY